MKFHISYQIIIWSLVLMALIMAGGFLTISYTYQVQDANSQIIEENIQNVRAAKELEITLYGIRAISLNYIIDKDSAWVDRLSEKEAEFGRALDKANETANTQEEHLLIQQITALFSNYQQNLNTALLLEKQGNLLKANALLVHGSRDLINTIEDKCKDLIESNQNEQADYEDKLLRNNNFIRVAMYSLGTGGLILGIILGWLVARIILNPIYKLVLKVRDAAGSELVEHVKMSPGKELQEIDLHINRMISRINQAHEDLEKNRQLLEKSSKLAAIGRIAPAIAHEIRNPLAAIKMLIYSMKNEQDIPTDQQHDLQVIVGEIDRMEGFLQNFLKYARPAKPVLKQIDIQAVIREMVYLMTPRFKQSKVEIVEEYQSGEVMVNADADQLKQVLMNLLLNATEAMNTGGNLSIRSAIVAGEKDSEYPKWLEVKIRDNGPGIPEEVMQSLFDPFVKGKASGVGLGLSISQRILELHHGWIDAVNNADKGATFTIHIPVI
jgi:two-component system, NtrC family, sensor histidine kinase HydH